MRRLLLISCLVSSVACGDDDCPPGTMPSGGACVIGDAGTGADGSGPCSDGETRSCGTDEGSCAAGTQTCTGGGVWGACEGETPAGVETCNGIDDDCNGIVDDDTMDSGAACGEGTGACEPGVETCIAGVLECFGGVEMTEEVCNEIDDDCDGMTDEGVLTTFYVDADGDGRGDPASPVEACAMGPGVVATADDCDDTCEVCWTGAEEVCDGFDNDCSGAADEGLTTTYYPDTDGDGFGAPEGEEFCEPTLGYVVNSRDCDDDDDEVNPAQTAYFAVPRADGSFDYNCDGARTYRYARVVANMCGGSFCSGTGFTFAPPDCGVSGRRRVCGFVGRFPALCTETSSTIVTQECR